MVREPFYQDRKWSLWRNGRYYCASHSGFYHHPANVMDPVDHSLTGFLICWAAGRRRRWDGPGIRHETGFGRFFRANAGLAKRPLANCRNGSMCSAASVSRRSAVGQQKCRPPFSDRKYVARIGARSTTTSCISTCPSSPRLAFASFTAVAPGSFPGSGGIRIRWR